MYSPHTHLEISRARQADMIREAQKHELVRRFSPERPSLLARLRERLGTEGAKRPAVHPAKA